ncbi:MAG: alpha/beta hydrolase fold domain-containing protein [Pseudomonadales bacterium]|jgi:acetyl esterase/lipase|nr:alpha/beta hydrolase fold domain-containing protein [Pseudomonadales bacterium]MDP6469796.1 alpha/beta hydrolase fold domain-containing protein [Pseudomonadales bacterium]MDP6971266.1 alpha/beta hydrolase fold domain-containing protein [Pseudomonadales bacterium]|tara:strand:- start:2443 stop:2655 length:213 start_codon:yes stop_codon:yes gene_type:complete
MAHIAPFAGTDGIAAMRIVAKHAAEFGIDKNRIGFMGFSAGGRVTMSVAFYHDAATRPEFLAPVYAGLGH